MIIQTLSVRFNERAANNDTRILNLTLINNFLFFLIISVVLVGSRPTRRRKTYRTIPYVSNRIAIGVAYVNGPYPDCSSNNRKGIYIKHQV